MRQRGGWARPLALVSCLGVLLGALAVPVTGCGAKKTQGEPPPGGPDQAKKAAALRDAGMQKKWTQGDAGKTGKAGATR
jgi:hypothetical protein